VITKTSYTYTIRILRQEQNLRDHGRGDDGNDGRWALNDRGGGGEEAFEGGGLVWVG